MKASKWIVAFALIAGALGFAYLGLSWSKRHAGKQESDDKPVPVRVAKVQEGDIADEIVLTGDVKAFSLVRVFSKIPGRVELLRVAESDPVKRGQLLAIIDHEAIKAQVAQAKAALAVAKAAFKIAQVALADAEREHKRVETLFKQGAVNEQSSDRARTALEAAKAQKELAGAQIEQAKAVLKAAEVQLSEATVEATIDGLICEKLVDQGDTVSAAAPLLCIVQMDRVKIIAGLVERDLPRIEAGKTPALVEVDACPGKAYEGKVTRIYPTLDSRTRTATVEVLLDNPKGELRPGMFARVRLVVAKHAAVPFVPRDVILKKNGKQFVYVVEGDVARRRFVKTGLRQDTRVEITEGVQPGQLIVTTGMQYLRPDIKVLVAEGGQGQ